jgi:hypothetical protein
MLLPPKRSQHRGNGGGEGVLARRRRRWGSSGGGVHPNHFLGGPAVIQCVGNEILRSNSGQKVGPRFIGSSISNSSIWNCC